MDSCTPCHRWCWFRSSDSSHVSLYKLNDIRRRVLTWSFGSPSSLKVSSKSWKIESAWNRKLDAVLLWVFICCCCLWWLCILHDNIPNWVVKCWNSLYGRLQQVLLSADWGHEVSTRNGEKSFAVWRMTFEVDCMRWTWLKCGHVVLGRIKLFFFAWDGVYSSYKATDGALLYGQDDEYANRSVWTVLVGAMNKGRKKKILRCKW